MVVARWGSLRLVSVSFGVEVPPALGWLRIREQPTVLRGTQDRWLFPGDLAGAAYAGVRSPLNGTDLSLWLAAKASQTGQAEQAEQAPGKAVVIAIFRRFDLRDRCRRRRRLILSVDRSRKDHRECKSENRCGYGLHTFLHA